MLVILSKLVFASCPDKNIPFTRLSAVSIVPFGLYSFTDGQDAANLNESKVIDRAGGFGDATLSLGAHYLSTSVGVQIPNGEVAGNPISLPFLAPSTIPAPFSIELWFSGQGSGLLLSHRNSTFENGARTGTESFLLTYVFVLDFSQYLLEALVLNSSPLGDFAPPESLHHVVLAFNGSAMNIHLDGVAWSPRASADPVNWNPQYALQLAPQFSTGNSWSGTIHMFSVWRYDISAYAQELYSCRLPNSRPITPSYRRHLSGDVVSTIQLCVGVNSRTSGWTPVSIWPYNDSVVEGTSACYDFDGDVLTLQITEMPTKYVIFDVQTSPDVWTPVTSNTDLPAPGGVVTLRYQPVYGENSWVWTSNGWQKNVYDSFQYQGWDSSSMRNMSEAGRVDLVVDIVYHPPLPLSQFMQTYPGAEEVEVDVGSTSIDLDDSPTLPDPSMWQANWSRIVSFPKWGTLSGVVNGPISPNQVLYWVNMSMALEAAQRNPAQSIIAYDVFTFQPCYRDWTFSVTMGANIPGITLVCGNVSEMTVAVMNFLQVGFVHVTVLEHALSAVAPSGMNTDPFNTDFNYIIDSLPSHGELLLWDGSPAMVGSRVPSGDRLKYNNTAGFGINDSFLYHIERLYGGQVVSSALGTQMLVVVEKNVPPVIGTPRLVDPTNPNAYIGAAVEFTQPFNVVQGSLIHLAIPINDSNTPLSQQEFTVTLNMAATGYAVLTVENQDTLSLAVVPGSNAPSNVVSTSFTCALAVCEEALSSLRVRGIKNGATSLIVTINDNSLLAGGSKMYDEDDWSPSPATVTYQIDLEIGVFIGAPYVAIGFTPIQRAGIYAVVAILPVCCLVLACALCWRRWRVDEFRRRKTEASFIVALDNREEKEKKEKEEKEKTEEEREQKLKEEKEKEEREKKLKEKERPKGKERGMSKRRRSI